MSETVASSVPPRERPRRRFRIRPAYVLLILFMGFFAYKFVQRTQEIKRLSVQEIALRQQNDALEAVRTRTQADIKYYGTMKYIEDTARSVLSYTKPGETSIQVPIVHAMPVEHARAAPAPHVVHPLRDPVAQWWHSFFG